MPVDPYFLNPKRERCARCGEVARGSARIGNDRYCHSDEPYPTCYMHESWRRAGIPTELAASYSCLGPRVELRLLDW